MKHVLKRYIPAIIDTFILVGNIKLVVECLVFPVISVAKFDGLEGLVCRVVLRSQLPEDAELVDSLVLNTALFAAQFRRHNYAENSWQTDIELLEQLHNMNVVTAVVKQRPQSLDDVHAVVLT